MIGLGQTRRDASLQLSTKDSRSVLLLHDDSHEAHHNPVSMPITQRPLYIVFHLSVTRVERSLMQTNEAEERSVDKAEADRDVGARLLQPHRVASWGDSPEMCSPRIHLSGGAVEELRQ